MYRLWNNVEKQYEMSEGHFDTDANKWIADSYFEYESAAEARDSLDTSTEIYIRRILERDKDGNWTEETIRDWTSAYLKRYEIVEIL
jgi:hypothetical protein